MAGAHTLTRTAVCSAYLRQIRGMSEERREIAAVFDAVRLIADSTGSLTGEKTPALGCVPLV
jgi:hypothetical protein